MQNSPAGPGSMLHTGIAACRTAKQHTANDSAHPSSFNGGVRLTSPAANHAVDLRGQAIKPKGTLLHTSVVILRQCSSGSKLGCLACIFIQVCPD